MNNNTQTRTVKISISLPMDFPADWDDDMISGGCICEICSAEVMSKEEQDAREKLGVKSFDGIIPSCPNCVCLDNCKAATKDPNMIVKCIWYDWLKSGEGKNCG